jgi:hypothetical protein
MAVQAVSEQSGGSGCDAAGVAVSSLQTLKLSAGIVVYNDSGAGDR